MEEVVETGYGQGGFWREGRVWVQPASERLPSNFTWVEKNTPLC